MNESKSTLFEDLKYRGLVYQTTTPELEAALAKAPLSLYAGFDPTSDSLHIGNLVPILVLRRFQLAGHTPIALVGGATGRVGDPSGKSTERNLLDDDQIKKNQEGIRKVIERFLSPKGNNGVEMVNNVDWFKEIGFLEFLRDVGKHFTVNLMIAKDSVKSRLEDRSQGISYTEFSYMLLQAFDFKHLHQTKGCRLQIGASDQWGNITAGTELIRRMAAAESKEAPEVFGLTHPLITKADGTKFGKTAGGAIWLSADKTSPYHFYQYFLRTADADIAHYLKVFTFLDHTEIERLEKTVETAPEKREAQKTLAEELTRLVHGEQELQRAKKASQALFGTDIKDLEPSLIKDVFTDAPSTKKSASSFPLPLVDLLVETKLCASKGAARRDITAGGVYVNNERVKEATAEVTSKDLIGGEALVLRKGKKNYHLVWVNPVRGPLTHGIDRKNDQKSD